MGFKFRKSINLGGGLKLNINKNSVSVSGGVKGARVSVNSKGKATTTLGERIGSVNSRQELSL
ncbi:TPA: DUF4236 domain-containing protein [Clostridioides difficile]|nr:DUF4236 domain-containing protein [Clostridioides difficile]